MPGDEITPGELGRRYDQLRSDMREDFAEINSRLDKMPTEQLLKALLDGRSAQIDRHTDDIAELKEHRKADVASRQSERRFLIAGVLVPIALAVLALVLTIGGTPT